MALYETLDADFVFCDSRGKLIQLVHRGYKQINVIESNKGVIRGGHYHKVVNEAFFVVSGNVDVSLRKGNETETIRFSKNDFFRIKPYVIHKMSFPDNCVMIALYDKPVELKKGNKDVYSEEE